MGAFIPIAIQLAQFAPALMRYFGAGQESAAVAEQAVEIAKTVTGATTPEAALAALKASGVAQLEFQKHIMDNDTELTRIYLADIQDARKRDAEFLKAGTRNYRADFLVAASFLLVALILYKVWTMPELPEFVKATISLILGRLLGYIDQVFQFEFGSTKNNREKDQTIRILSGQK